MVGAVAWMALLVLLVSAGVAGRVWRVMNAVVFDGETTDATAVKAVARRTIFRSVV